MSLQNICISIDEHVKETLYLLTSIILFTQAQPIHDSPSIGKDSPPRMEEASSPDVVLLNNHSEENLSPQHTPMVRRKQLM